MSWVLSDENYRVKSGRYKIELNLDMEGTGLVNTFNTVELGKLKYATNGEQGLYQSCDDFQLKIEWNGNYGTAAYWAMVNILGTEYAVVNIYKHNGTSWVLWEFGTIDKASVSGDLGKREIKFDVIVGLERVGETLVKESEYSLGMIKISDLIEWLISTDAQARTLEYDDELLSVGLLSDPQVYSWTDKDVLSCYLKEAIYLMDDTAFSTWGDVAKSLLNNIGCSLMVQPELKGVLVSNIYDGSDLKEIAKDDIIKMSVRYGVPKDRIRRRVWTCDQWEYTGNFSYTDVQDAESNDLEAVIMAAVSGGYDLAADIAAPYSVTSLFESATPGEYGLIAYASAKRKYYDGVRIEWLGTKLLAQAVAIMRARQVNASYKLRMKGVDYAWGSFVKLEDSFEGFAFQGRRFRVRGYELDLAEDVTEVEMVEV